MNFFKAYYWKANYFHANYLSGSGSAASADDVIHNLPFCVTVGMLKSF